jgi:hypothetical protein
MGMLSDLVAPLGLPKLAAALSRPPYEALVLPTQRLKMPPPTLLDVLHEHRRWGHCPPMIELLLAELADRPLERALAAWDILSSTILDEQRDADLLKRLRDFANRARQLLPPPQSLGARFDTLSSAAAVAHEAVRWRDADEDKLLQAYTNTGDIGALGELHRRFGADTIGPAVDAARRFGRILHLSHLPTLATLHLDYAWSVLGAREALDDLVEVYADLTDSELLPRPERYLPAKTPADLNTVGYQVVRHEINQGHFTEAYAKVKAAAAAVDFAAMGDDELRVQATTLAVLTELATEIEPSRCPIPLELLGRVLGPQSEWRYGTRVFVTHAAALAGPADGEALLSACREFVARFGSDFQFWFRVGNRLRHPELAQPFERLLLEQLAMNPNDLYALAATSMRLLSGEKSPLDELNARRRAQTTFPYRL